MILHIIPAEKFVDRAISLFEEAAPQGNVFYIFSQEEDAKDLNFVKTPASNRIKKVPFGVEWWKKGFINFSGYKHVFFHNLFSPQNLFFARKVPSNIIKHSIIWGVDFYGFKPFWPHEKFGELTTQLNKKLGKSVSNYYSQNEVETKGKIGYLIYRSWKLISDKKYAAYFPTIANRKKAFESSDFIHSHVTTDIEHINNTFNINSKWSNFSYYAAEDYKIENKAMVRHKILLGNSATASNNHLEVLEILKSKTEDFSIVCPLNYGDMEYANFIKQIGKNVFQDKFKALTEFLPLNDYNKLQAECPIVIMNHYRQQAAGNLIAAFLLGSKVFMSTKSPLYQHFRSLNLHVYTVEEDLSDKNALKELNHLYKKENQEIIKGYYSRETIIKAILDSLK